MQNLDQVLMFCTESNLRMADWMHVKAAEAYKDCDVTTQHCYLTDLQHCSPSTYHGIPALIVASFDIETYSHSRDFPESLNPLDTTIQIGVVLGKYGTDEILRIVLCLKDVNPSTEDATYFLGFENEADLLSAFQHLIVKYDVDIVTGYNIYSFDYAYLCDRAERIKYFSSNSTHDYEDERHKYTQYRLLEKRAEKLEKHDTCNWKMLLNDYTAIFDEETYFSDRLPPMPLITRLVGCYESKDDFQKAKNYFSSFDVSSFSFFHCSRFANEICEHKIVMLSSAAMGQNLLHRFPQTGRVIIDMWLWIKNNKSLQSYKLDFVSKHFLGEKKGKSRTFL